MDLVDSALPTAKMIQVDTRGAQILTEVSPDVRIFFFVTLYIHYCIDSYSGQTRDSRGIYLPNYIEPVSHIAVDVRAKGLSCLRGMHTLNECALDRRLAGQGHVLYPLASAAWVALCGCNRWEQLEPRNTDRIAAD